MKPYNETTRAAERGGLEGQAALGAKKRGAPKSGGREKKKHKLKNKRNK
jgi:hypothetical protein